jgi:5,10-methylene-tetrahydrofolate dehydrogenase/methenyl tetrahydrofolate cyclohydrolase
VRNKRKRGVEAGMRDTHRYLSGDVTQETAVAVIDELASDPDVTRILVQLPLPPHLNAAALIDPIRAGKDVDGPHGPTTTACPPASSVPASSKIADEVIGQQFVQRQ